MLVEKEAGNNYINTDFLKVNSRDCTLLIEFAEEGFSYSILNNFSNELLYSSESKSFIDFFQSEELQLLDIFNQEEVFKFSFNKVIVLINNFYNTLVPTPFFDENKKRDILSFNVSLPKVDLIYLTDKIANIDYYNIYVNTLNFSKVIGNTFIDVQIKSTVATLLDYAYNFASKGKFLQVHLSKSKIHCIYFNEGKLEYNNSFKIDNSEDIIYNVLNIYSQLGLNTEKMVLHLSGEVTSADEKYELLYMYIKNIEFLKRPLKLNYADRVKEIPSHRFVQHFIALL